MKYLSYGAMESNDGQNRLRVVKCINEMKMISKELRRRFKTGPSLIDITASRELIIKLLFFRLETT